MIEIELKAHVKDVEAVKAKLKPKYYYGNFVKNDAYWKKDGFTVRVRREAWQGGETKAIVTYKVKSVLDGIEVNDEREFTVSDFDLFEEMLMNCGLKPDFHKRKVGEQYRYGDVTIELCKVFGTKDLGWFLELEVITDSTVSVDTVREKLFSLIEEFGLSKYDIETSFYADF
jgi:predicted adenylyl cyclase CyaB